MKKYNVVLVRVYPMTPERCEKMVICENAGFVEARRAHIEVIRRIDNLFCKFVNHYFEDGILVEVYTAEYELVNYLVISQEL